MQVTVAFAGGVPVMDLVRVLESRYHATVEVGQGQMVNGIPLHTIVVTRKGES
jgi:hypothetical protein